MPAKLYTPSGAAELKARALRDLRLTAIDAGVAEPAVGPGSDYDFLSTMVSESALLGFANIASLESAADVFGADGEDLDDIREAEGLPVLGAVGSAGRIVIETFGSLTISDGQQFTFPNGRRGRVSQQYVNPEDGAEIEAESIDTGSAVNFPGGTVVTFKAPPLNLGATAKISNQIPMTGGRDQERDPEKRDRILAARKDKPAGGNWAQLRKIARDASGIVQDAYVYPALGGPASMKLVAVKRFYPANRDFSRALPAAALDLVTSAVHAQVTSGVELPVQTVVNEVVDFGLEIEIPDAVDSGGDGSGWVDETPWPPLVTADGGYVTIDAVNTDKTLITVSAETATTPTAGVTHVSWWSSSDRRFYHSLVVGVSGGSGAWVLTLDVPFVDSVGNGPVLGDYLSPQARNLDSYGQRWVELFNALGPGENYGAYSAHLARRSRHPLTSAGGPPSAITRATLKALLVAHPEITDVAFSFSPQTSPTTPADVTTAPNILVPRRLGFYPLTS